MKNENEFNRHLKSGFQKVGTSIKAIKVSDRFHIGASDWLVFVKGNCHAIEAKFVKKLQNRGKLLRHVVSGPQVTFMHSMELAGVKSWVLIGVGDLRKMFLLRWDYFYESGNMAVEDFRILLDRDEILSFPMSDVDELVGYLHE